MKMKRGKETRTARVREDGVREEKGEADRGEDGGRRGKERDDEEERGR
jgi:hypothetical protein